MFDTYLNVKPDNIFDAIKNCWASQFTARSFVYGDNLGVDGLVESKFAIVVQRMVQSEISGVCFTEETGSLDKNRMLMEAVWGLGESLVGGEISPDSYIFNKSNLSILESKIQPQTKMRVRDLMSGIKWESISSHRSIQPKLQGQSLNELELICKDLEQTFEHACDIEWTIANNVISILQCRPITKK